jgi:hypothetical protein
VNDPSADASATTQGPFEEDSPGAIDTTLPESPPPGCDDLDRQPPTIPLITTENTLGDQS